MCSAAVFAALLPLAIATPFPSVGPTVRETELVFTRACVRPDECAHGGQTAIWALTNFVPNLIASAVASVVPRSRLRLFGNNFLHARRSRVDWITDELFRFAGFRSERLRKMDHCLRAQTATPSRSSPVCGSTPHRGTISTERWAPRWQNYESDAVRLRSAASGWVVIPAAGHRFLHNGSER